MADDLVIQVIGRDGVTRVFKQVSDSATKMGDAVEKAGDEGKKGMDELGKSAESNAQKLERMKAEATAIGAVIGTLGAGIMLLGRNSRDAELQIDAINRAYEDQADIILDLTERVQDYSRFSNDSAREAALTFQTLVDNYGVSLQQLDELMIRSADVAQLRGRSLEDVSQMLQNAIRGEAEYAEAVGVTLNDTFLAAEYARRGLGEWSKVTDEMERAQFRFQILMEQTAYAAGTAGDQVANAGGRFRQFINNVDDAAEAAGEFLGPIAEIGAEMAPIAVALPVVTGYLGRLSTALKGTAVAAAGVQAVLGGVALVVGAGLGAAVAGSVEALLQGESATERLDAAFGRLQSGDIIGFFEAMNGEIGDTNLRIDSLREAVLNLNADAAVLRAAGAEQSAGYVQQLANEQNTIRDMAESLLEAETLREEAMRRQAEAGGTLAENERVLREEYTLTLAETQALAEANQALAAAYLDPKVNAEQLAAAQSELYWKYVEGDLTLDGYVASLNDLAREYGLLPPLIDEVTDAADRQTTGIERLNESRRTALEILGDLDEAERDALAWETERERTAYANRQISAETLKEQQEEARQAAEEMQQLREEWIAATLAIGGYDNALSQVNLAGLGGEAGAFAEQVRIGNEALDNTFRIIVGNTNAIIQQVEGVQSWADSLINIRGELGRIDELIEGGFIDSAQYDAAQNAYDSIADSVFQVKGNLEAVQAIQAPFIADMLAGTVAWTDELRNMEAEQQRVALAFMDMTTVTTAQEIAIQGHAAAIGQWGAEGQDAFEAMIHGALQANPLLFEVLETMGILEGTAVDFDINWDALAEGGSELSKLTTSINHLVDSLREIYGLPPIRVDVDTGSVDDAARGVDFLYERVTNADGTEAYLIVRVDETGEKTVDEIKSSVDNLDGTYTVQVEAKTGETYEAVLGYDGEVISTSYVNIEPQIGGGIPNAGNVNSALQHWFGDTYSFDPIEVPVTVVPGSATTGDGTGGASNWRDLLDIPESAETALTVTTTGLEDVEAAQTAIAELEDTTITVTIDVDASALDTSLAQWGIGDGGGGGGAAGFDNPTVRVVFEADTSAIDEWTPSEIDPIEVAITGNAGGQDGALTVLSNLQSGGKEGYSVEVAVTTAGGPEAVSALDGVTAAADAIPESESVTVVALAEGATVALQGVTAAAVDIPEAESVSVSVFGADSAVSALNSVANAAAGVPDSVSTTITTYRDTVYRVSGERPYAHGGLVDMPAFAAGGLVPFRAGEAGMEMLHFPTGGMVPMPSDGYYAAPVGSYVSPAPASVGKTDGLTILAPITVQGNVYGITDLTEKVMREMGPAIQAAMHEHQRGMGA